MTDRPNEATGGVGDRDRFADGPVVIFTWRNERGWPVEYVSPNVDRLLGYTPAELYGTDLPYAELIHDDDLERVIREVEANSDETTERFHHEPYRMVTKDGTVRWVLDYTRIIREYGSITGYTGYIVDITEWKTQIEYVNTLNATIRSLHTALIDAGSKEEVHHDVCEALVELDGFAGTWIGTVDPSTEEIAPVAQSAVPDTYLDTISLVLDENGPIPAVRIVTERSTTSEHCVIDDRSECLWRTAALACGFQSVCSVPIRHRELYHGVLTVYGANTDTFDSRIREILTELGTLVGYAITAVERRNALHSDEGRELVLEIASDGDDPLQRLATQLSSTVEVRSVSHRKQDSPLLYCLIPNVSPDVTVEAAADVSRIESIRPLSETEASIYELVTAGDCMASKATVLGASFRSMCFEERSCELVVSVHRGHDQRRFIGQVRDLFGDVSLKAERDTTPLNTMPWAAILTDTLTERQRDVLKAAYHAGYFDENRKQTGAEIADSLGIAQPTFSRHIRAAQRNLLAALWECPDME